MLSLVNFSDYYTPRSGDVDRLRLAKRAFLSLLLFLIYVFVPKRLYAEPLDRKMYAIYFDETPEFLSAGKVFARVDVSKTNVTPIILCTNLRSLKGWGNEYYIFHFVPIFGDFTRLKCKYLENH